MNEIEKDVYNINKAPKNNTNLEDNLDINRISISQNSEKMSIIDFVIDSFEENKIPKFSIYKNNDLGTLNNNYKNPFSKFNLKIISFYDLLLIIFNLKLSN